MENACNGVPKPLQWATRSFNEKLSCPFGDERAGEFFCAIGFYREQ